MAELGRIWPRLGFAAAKVADALATGGVLTILLETGNSIYPKRERVRPGLDWNLSYGTVYSREIPNLLRIYVYGEQIYLPQVPIFLPDCDFDPEKVSIELLPDDYAAKHRIEEVLTEYKRTSKGKIFFDGENARLVSVSDDKFIFQGCSYFDYIATNLSLDHPYGMFGSLRKQVHGTGSLEPLHQSLLANSTGVNGLVFSSDGYLVLQRRRWNVLVRPGQICPGFSGTVDKADIVGANVHGGKLAHLDSAREMVEELGVASRHVSHCRFLGVTRELIRGGKPEMFYSVDLSMSKSDIEKCYAKDIEGDPLFIPFGTFGSGLGLEGKTPPVEISKLLELMAKQVQGRFSLPLITNLVLWHRACWRRNDGRPSS